MKELKQEIKALDYRLLNSSNWFFISLLWLVLILQWKLVDIYHALTLSALLIIYSTVHFYNSVLRGKINNNEIVTISFINVFACAPLLYYVPGFNQEIWIFLIWASIAISTFNEMRNVVLILILLSSMLFFITFFSGGLDGTYQVVILLMKISVIFFIGITFAKMQKEHYQKEAILEDINKNLEEKVIDRTKQIEEVTSSAIVSLAKLTESRDPETGSHLERIQIYTDILANELRKERKLKSYITEKYVKELVQSSILHDIGKVGIPDNILLKKGALIPEETKIMQTHTIIGGDSLEKAYQQTGRESFLSLAREIAYYHHEKYNGCGYPKGLKGENIPLSARIVCVTDVYDALRSKRPYRGALSHEKTMEIMRVEMAGSFDPVIFKVLERVADRFCEVAAKIT